MNTCVYDAILTSPEKSHGYSAIVGSTDGFGEYNHVFSVAMPTVGLT